MLASNIREYIRKYHRSYFYNGKWGCCRIGFEGITEQELKKQHPNGFSVMVDKKYWVWFDHD